MKYGIVLGASSGVGAAIARRLLHEDRRVIGVHRGNHPGEANDLEAAGVSLVRLDAGASYEAAVAAFDEVRERLALHSVSVLVHSLSGASIGGALGMMPKKIERTFNCLAHSFMWWVYLLWVNNYFTPNACVIALSNPCPDFYLASSGVIGPAKAALEAYVRVLAAELGSTGITVNCVRFSTVITPALQKVMPQAIGRLHELHESIVPAGRIQTVADVANIVSLLTRDDAKWINGAIIDGTGGAPSMLMNYAFHGKR